MCVMAIHNNFWFTKYNSTVLSNIYLYKVIIYYNNCVPGDPFNVNCIYTQLIVRHILHFLINLKIVLNVYKNMYIH